MEAAQGKHTFTVDMNKFADLTNQEWRDMLLREKPLQSGEGFCDNEYLRDDRSHDAPKKVNWVKQGYVTPIKDQKKCGSCWAFSTTGSLEGQMFAKTGKLVSYSEQNLVDCSQAEGNMGCHGGLMDHGFEYIHKNGIETEEDYPYTAVDGHCKYNASMSVATVSGCVDIKPDPNQIFRTPSPRSDPSPSVSMPDTSPSNSTAKVYTTNKPAVTPDWIMESL